MENQGKENQVQKGTDTFSAEERKDKKKTRTKVMPILKITWNVIEKIIVIVILFVCAIIATQRLTNNQYAFLGFRIFRVQTGSMIPKYQIGDVILVKEKDPNKIEIGEDVTYRGKAGSMKGLTVTHQVINIEVIDGQKTFHTKGIANNLEDPVIYGEQIEGVVKGKLQILTILCTLLTNKYIFYFAGIVPLTIYIFFSFVRHNMRKFED